MRLYKMKSDSFDEFNINTESEVLNLYREQLKEAEALEDEYYLLEETRLNMNKDPFDSLKLMPPKK